MKLEPGIIYFFTGVNSDKVQELWQTWDGFSDLFEYPECDFDNFKVFTEQECAIKANALIEEFANTTSDESWLVISNSNVYFQAARLNVVRGKLNHKKVKFLFLNEFDELIEIHVNHDGSTDRQPKGFFDQIHKFLGELMQLRCEKAKAKKNEA